MEVPGKGDLELNLRKTGGNWQIDNYWHASPMLALCVGLTQNAGTYVLARYFDPHPSFAGEARETSFHERERERERRSEMRLDSRQIQQERERESAVILVGQIGRAHV